MHGEAGAVSRDQRTIEPYSWYMLAVLVLVYVLNFVDRQLITILAPDLKRDLGISDSDFGFLYGTAFGVFYAVFGLPLGRLADRWFRVRLLALGLALWSAMTALSGLSRNFVQLGLARIGVGIGEATATPCAYSLISDSFPPHRRATALALYSAGLYIGGGISLFLGSSIAQGWDQAFAGGTAPLGLAGWQIAFLAVGIPGMLLALWVATLREPVRGRFEASTFAAADNTTTPGKEFLREAMDVVPPLTLFAAARRGIRPLAANLAGAAVIAALMALLVRLTGDMAQWLAFGLGCYAIYSWVCALRLDSQETYQALLRSRPFLALTVSYSLVCFVGYASTAFMPLYAIEVLGADAKQAGFILGGAGAAGGVAGVMMGGMIADRLARDGNQSMRILVITVSAIIAMLCHAALFTASSLAFYYVLAFISWVFLAATLGGSSGALVNIVRPELRGTATAGFLLGTNMIGLALGPYTAGKISMVTGDLGLGLLSLLIVVPFMLMALGITFIDLAADYRRAKAA